MVEISSNRRIAINTAILYVKLIVSIVVSFIVSRLILQALGASDYGLYNVVGGIVAMLNTFSASMVATSYRYMAVELGKNENGNPNKVYNTIFVIHLLLALLLLLLGETLGAFYVKNYLNIDQSRLSDALYVLHLSLLTTAFAVITIPTNGLIIAKEKFLFTSLLYIVESLFKLMLIILLTNIDGNRLRVYATMMAVLQFANPVCYQIYCRLNYYEIVKWSFNYNWKDYKEILGFTVWMFLGATAVIGQVQGAAMVINYYFGTILNAAFGLASQVQSIVSQFATTLRQAFVPQIMKNQELNEERSLNLVYAISRYSFLTMSIISIPLLFQIKPLLEIWLGNPPKFTEFFISFMLINGMILNLASGFDASIQATGKVKKNQIGYCLINLSLIPLMYVCYKHGLPSYSNVIIMVGLAILTIVFQSKIMSELTAFKLRDYIYKTIIPCLLSTLFAIVPLFFLKLIYPTSSGILAFLFLLISGIWTFVSILICGISKNERDILKKILYTSVNNIKSMI